MTARFSIDSWDPSYGSPFEEGDPSDSTADVNPDVEMPSAQWTPVGVPWRNRPKDVRMGPLPEPVVVVDGVRRIDARIWIEAQDGPPVPGLCASWAAGAVRCGERAEIAAAVVGRAVFTPSASASAVITPLGTYEVHVAVSGDPDRLSLALQERMALDEVKVSMQARSADLPPALLVVDGPLRGRQHLTDAIGLIKTQHVRYLPEQLDPVLGLLEPGQRTPVFTVGTSWTRSSWYLRLPGGDPSASRSGIVRCEAASDRSMADVVALADRTTLLLPKLASSRHRDPRAPQNLVPIAGLERVLRHRLGDRALLERALRRAAAASATEPAVRPR
jgi:hypothetical protein